MKPRYLDIFTISKPEFEHEPVWVINITEGNTRGPVSVTVEKQGGGYDSVLIPDTWLPVNLVNEVSRNQLINSSHFRQALKSNMIRLVDNTYAEFLNGQDGADVERQRLLDTGHNPFGAHYEAVPEKTAKRERECSAKVEHIMGKLASEGEVGIINSLRTIKTSLEERDLKYVFFEAKKNDCKKLMKWAKDTREELGL